MNLCSSNGPRIRTLTAMPYVIAYTLWNVDPKVVVRGVGEDAKFEQKWRGTPKDYDCRNADPYLIRDAFLAIKTVSDAAAFLEACGPFRTNVYKTTMQEIRGWQEFFRPWLLYGYGAMPFPPVEDLEYEEDGRICGCLSWDIGLVRWTGRVEAAVECESALEAIGASIAIDLLEGAEFRDCLWCKALFQVTKDNGRQYCTPACAHRGGQKRRREAAKALRAKAAKQQLKAKKGRT